MVSADAAGVPVVEAPVLIIGSSMVGMTLSALLAKFGIRDCITIDKHSSTAIHPRAALFHPRTMQIYRELGLYEQMKEESYKHYDQKAGLYDVDSLAATLKGGRVSTWMKDINEWIGAISPTSRLFLTQQMFEPLLRKHAVDHGAALRFSTELIDFQQDAGGVTALVRSVETGAKQLVRAKFMVACDGNRSFVRERLGIKMKGHGLLSYSLTIYFQSDLSRFVEGRYNGVIYVNNEHLRGFFRLDKKGREGFLVVNTYGKRGTEESRRPADGITNEKAAEMLRNAIGADVEFTITHLSPWRAVCDVAEKLASGRVLLAGDAAHTGVPNGGFMGNTGIQDAHNLAWKLALVLKSLAGEELVTKSYQDERWPVAKKTIDQVFERWIVRTDASLRTEDIEVEEEVPEPHLELGYRYHSRALTTSSLGSVTSDPATAKATPGSMAHHVLINTAEQDFQLDIEPFPIADLLGDTFVLICGHDALPWVRAARNIKIEEQHWLPEISLTQLSSRTSKPFYDKYAVSAEGCVLIRPDGFVAWSESNGAVYGMGAIGMPAPEAVLKCVMRRILCLDPLVGKTYAEASSPPPPYINNAVQASYKEAASLAESLFRQTKTIENEKAALEERRQALEVRLADLNRLSKLQDEMAMLSMRLSISELESGHEDVKSLPDGTRGHDLGPG